MNSEIVQIESIRKLTDPAYVLCMNRGSLNFVPGQYIRIGFPGELEKREYSIYSGDTDNYLEVLIREVDNGYLSKALKNSEKGQNIELDGPYGFFTLNPEEKIQELVFIASGTGISPFHSYVRSNPNLNFRLIHGVRFGNEQYDQEHYPSEKYIACTSQDKKGNFNGRVTDFLLSQKLNENASYFLCGNSNMIHEVMDILTDKSIPLERIRTEVYF